MTVTTWGETAKSIWVIIGQAKQAPHWGVQSRFRVIYIYLQVKKKAFKINGKIEDVGLNED